MTAPNPADPPGGARQEKPSRARRFARAWLLMASALGTAVVVCAAGAVLWRRGPLMFLAAVVLTYITSVALSGAFWDGDDV